MHGENAAFACVRDETRPQEPFAQLVPGAADVRLGSRDNCEVVCISFEEVGCFLDFDLAVRRDNVGRPQYDLEEDVEE